MMQGMALNIYAGRAGEVGKLLWIESYACVWEKGNPGLGLYTAHWQWLSLTATCAGGGFLPGYFNGTYSNCSKW